mmetsp:Transcript_17050/g.17100  ORF Transcript_17050/g.17100 Transcript_17050/m.17100 type:complete len:84 (+) Transcript_17050:498-749(+)
MPYGPCLLVVPVQRVVHVLLFCVCVCDFDYIIILDQRRGWSLRNENNNEKGWSTHVNPLWITIVYGIVEKHKTRVFYFQLAMN